LLDLEIINNTNGEKSLDDVMKYMYTEYYKGKNRGFTDEEFKQGLELIAGKNLDEFYQNYIYGLTPIDYNKYFHYAGYKLSNELAGRNDPSLGISTINTNNKIVIAAVTRNSAAWINGLNVNDEITAINDENVTSLDGVLSDKNPGDKINISIVRDGLPKVITVTLTKSVRVNYIIEPLSKTNEKQLIVRKKWLKL